jgi:hypothetical protein
VVALSMQARSDVGADVVNLHAPCGEAVPWYPLRQVSDTSGVNSSIDFKRT